ncbi:MAG: nucleotidyltransferase domain-containing protein [Cyanobacteria bacterium P01_G01_bin.19]
MTYLNQSFAVTIPYEEIIEFCQRWKVEQFYLFGSVLRSDFTKDSDIDVMVKFLPEARIGWKIVTMNDELEKVFHRRVDLVTKDAIEKSKNWIRRQNILDSVVLIYEQKK